MSARRVYVAGTCDTKGDELAFVCALVERDGCEAVIVDLSARAGGTAPPGSIGPEVVAAAHPDGRDAVFRDDRGEAVAGMGVAFERFLRVRDDVAGVIGLGGSGGTAMITKAMRALPVGLPKLMISTVASANVAPYVGSSDIAMMYSVTDIAGLNRISRVVLANAAHAIAGMARAPAASVSDSKSAVGLTMFGVTTPCVNGVVQALQDRFDCLVFHATGTGGQAMEKLADSGLINGLIDVTTTEVCDLLLGGVFPCTEDRFGAVARTRLPYVGSCGALDMVNFGALDSVPTKYRDRQLYVHNPQVTLMRTTPDECAAIGRWIGNRLNECEGEVRFLLPEGGVSLLDAPGMAFHDPRADEALFAAIESTIRQTEHRQVRRVPAAINDTAFVAALVGAFGELTGDG